MNRRSNSIVGSLVLEPISKNIEILFQEAFFTQSDRTFCISYGRSSFMNRLLNL